MGGIAFTAGPLRYDQDGLNYLAEGARRFRAETSRASLVCSDVRCLKVANTCSVWKGSIAPGWKPRFCPRFLDELTAIYLRRLELYLQAVGPYIDVLACYDDYGMQTGLQISPKMYREFFKPRQALLWKTAKRLAPVKVLLHSCGSIFHILSDMIDAGLDAITPVQISAVNMEPARLKERYGRRLTFWGGGCDTQHVLRAGSPAAIKEHVFRNLEVFSREAVRVPAGSQYRGGRTSRKHRRLFDAVSAWNSAQL